MASNRVFEIQSAISHYIDHLGELASPWNLGELVSPWNLHLRRMDMDNHLTEKIYQIATEDFWRL